MTPTHREKFQTLLRKLFQFDCAELDFGIYRIMNHKRQAVEDFIQNDLLAAVAGELRQGALAQEAGLFQALEEKKLAVIDTLGEDALDAEGCLDPQWHKSKLGKEYLDLQQRASQAKGKPEVEAEIFNHLYTFFSRYYDSGDFMSLRRYSRREKYAIPYNGEEVHLHWANNDQYYIKTGENFTDYAYRHGAWTVRFALRNAEVEQNNVKGAKRFFLPQTDQLAVDEKEKSLTLPMHYRPLNEAEQALYAKKKKGGEDSEDDEEPTADTGGKAKGKTGIEGILADAVASLDKLTAKAPEGARSALSAEKRRAADGRPVPLIEHYLRFYTAKHSSDFFIHKDLGGFLARELDFYIKNDVLNVDELSEAGPARAEAWFQIMRCLKGVGIRIITFLAQIENFQKRLFEKKKFVTEANWCATLDRIPQSLYPKVLKNKQQLQEWRELFHIHEIEGDLASPGYSEPLTAEFLKSQPFLVLDTRFFEQEFKDALLASKEFLGKAETIEEATDGLLVNSDNLQALNLLSGRFQNAIKCCYIDPPYNTGTDGFPYKDAYQHSSWLAMMKSRMEYGYRFLKSGGALFSSIDDNEYVHLEQLQASVFGGKPEATIVRVNPSTKSWSQFLSTTHDYCILNIKDAERVASDPKWQIKKPYIDEFKKRTKAFLKTKLSDEDKRLNLREMVKIPMFKAFDHYTEFDEKGVYAAGNPNRTLQSEGAKTFPNVVLLHPITKKKCQISDNWRFDQKKTDELASRNPSGFHFGSDHKTTPRIKTYVDDYENMTPQSVVFDDTQVDTKTILPGMGLVFDFPKPLSFVRRILEMAAPPGSWCLDFFGGSGTTGHAVIALNREDNGGRKYLLIEMGKHFDTLIKPRLRKLTYSKDWKDGKPVSRAGSSHAFKYLRLESYEDALDNISFTDPQAPQSMLTFDDYTLGYMLDFETKDSATFLNVAALDAPFDYQLKLHGQDKPQPVDLPETFNYLLGLHVASRRVLHHRKVRYLVFTGLVEGRSTAIFWRTTRGWKKADWEAEREWVETEKLTAAAEDVWVNTDSFIAGARSLDPVFKKRMFNED